jgi:hypothetical protein
MSIDLLVDGSATVYRLYDVGYEIDLDRAAQLLGGDVRGRARPGRPEARGLEIRRPPLSVLIGDREVVIDGRALKGKLAAHVFDFGVCSLRFTVDVVAGTSWDQFTGLGQACDAVGLARFVDEELEKFTQRLRPAIEHPGIAPVVEEYVVFRVRTIRLDGEVASAETLTDDLLSRLLLGEREALSAGARRDLLGARFSYYEDDLTVLTWDNALILEPRDADTDVEYILEFANAQLLELRVYDAQLDAELPALYDRIEAARRRLLTGRFRSVLADVQTRVAEITEIVERADNALKVTDDVYLARIYDKALELFRERGWRNGINRKLTIFRETYAMLNDETQATRAELLELTIVLLIVFEIVLSFVR